MTHWLRRLKRLSLSGPLMGMFACATAPHVSGYFQIHGHRGARARRPENSLQAFRYAVGIGVTALEMDLGVTRDNQLVINHDFTVDTERCTSDMPSLASVQKPLIHDLTLKEIQSYNCDKKNPKFPLQFFVPGEKVKIPTFREFLILLVNDSHPQSQKVIINVETKIEEVHPSYTVEYKKFVELVMEEVKATSFPVERMILQSFDYRTIAYAKQKWPSLKTSALAESIPFGESPGQFVENVFKKTNADYLSPSGRICSSDLVNAVKTHGKKTVVYTINKKLEWRHFVRLGVDGIISDDPKLLIDDLY